MPEGDTRIILQYAQIAISPALIQSKISGENSIFPPLEEKIY